MIANDSHETTAIAEFEGRMKTEIDWTSDEAVVRAYSGVVWHQILASGPDLGKIAIMAGHLILGTGFMFTIAWHEARQHPTVQAFEREHNPEFQTAPAIEKESEPVAVVEREGEVAKAIVLAKWTDATTQSAFTGSAWTQIVSKESHASNGIYVLGAGLGLDAAWIDAASKLSPEAPKEAVDPALQPESRVPARPKRYSDGKDGERSLYFSDEMDAYIDATIAQQEVQNGQ